MKHHFNEKGNANTIVKLESLITSLMNTVAQLAPHPSRPYDTGAMFVPGANAFRPAAEYDGMGGAMMMESLIGSAMISDLIDIADSVSTVYTDRAITPRFNDAARRNHAMQAYRKDLPRRRQVESYIAVCLRELYALRGYAVRYELSLAA